MKLAHLARQVAVLALQLAERRVFIMHGQRFAGGEERCAFAVHQWPLVAMGSPRQNARHSYMSVEANYATPLGCIRLCAG